MADLSIILSADDRHAPYAGAVVSSAVKSSNPDDRICVYILTLGLNAINRANFERLSATLGVKISIVDASEALVQKLPDKGRTKTAYLRIFAGELLPEVSKAVYLDTDVLVRCSLAELFSHFSEDHVAAAAIDATVMTGWSGLSREVQSEEIRQRYFNSGVMILDLDHMRQDEASGKIVRIRLQNQQSVLHDQSALNLYYFGRISTLPLRYNYILSAYDYLNVETMDRWDLKLSDVSEPKIVHFANYKKPWLRRFPQRFASEYREHLSQTPWGSSAIAPMSFRNKIGLISRLPSHLLLSATIRARHFWFQISRSP